CGCAFPPPDLAFALQATPIPLRDEPVPLQVPEAEPVEQEAAPRRASGARRPSGEAPLPIRKSSGCGMFLVVGLLLGGGFLLAVGGGGLLVLVGLDSRPTGGTVPTKEFIASRPPAAPDREANSAKQPPPARPEGAGKPGQAFAGGADAPSIPLQTLSDIKAAT